jgi:hypothetical protein
MESTNQRAFEKKASPSAAPLHLFIRIAGFVTWCAFNTENEQVLISRGDDNSY